mmetsp:Transcript_104856/g.293919  ORF Transcript_104856/g.293919 Transcript_104856/m.293919 type:complete len:495 (-) Transcript_104856:72-1556(-)
MFGCCRCPEEICGVDVDDAFAYQTTKFVRIRDRRLGLAYYTALFGVFAYIGVYTLAYQLAYLEFQPTMGTTRLKLQQPVVDSCDVDSNECVDNFPATTDLKYCCREVGCEAVPSKGAGACNCSFRPEYLNFHCGFYDGDVVGIPQSSGIFAATRMRVQSEQLNTTCVGPSATQCSKLWRVASNATSFVAGIEHFTLLLDHAVQLPDASFSAQGRFLYGLLHIPGSGPLERALCAMPGAVDHYDEGRPTVTAPCYIEPSHPPNSNLDFFSLSTLLAAAGVDLDNESYAGSGHSARYEGLTMLIDIHYYNAVPWRGVLREPAYYYEVTAMRQNPWGQHKVLWDPHSTNRTVIAMHGVMIRANLGGTIGRFVFNNLLLQLAASLALLAGATTGVNCVAQYMMRYRAYYHAALVDKTADFSEVATLEAQSTEELREECRRRSLATGGNRVELISRLIADDHVDHADTVAGSARSDASFFRGTGPGRPEALPIHGRTLT